MNTVTENPLALAVVVEGKVISSNLPEFREAVTMFVGAINRDLATDEQFGQAEIDVKKLKALENSIAAAKEKALRDAEQLHALFTALDVASGEVSTARLDLEKQIEKQKKAVREQLVADALNRIICAPHLRLKTYVMLVENAIKGKRTLDSMEKALTQIVGSLNEQLAATKAVIEEWEAENEKCFDAETLLLESAETVRLKLQGRAQMRDAAREKKRLEEEAEREREMRLKAEAETKAAQQPQATPPVQAPIQAPSTPLPAAAPPIVTATDDEDEAAERARFVAIVRAAFLPIKTARELLKHPANIEAAKKFAVGVVPHWEALTKGGINE